MIDGMRHALFVALRQYLEINNGFRTALLTHLIQSDLILPLGSIDHSELIALGSLNRYFIFNGLT